MTCAALTCSAALDGKRLGRLRTSRSAASGASAAGGAESPELHLLHLRSIRHRSDPSIRLALSSVQDDQQSDDRQDAQRFSKWTFSRRKCREEAALPVVCVRRQVSPANHFIAREDAGKQGERADGAVEEAGKEAGTEGKRVKRTRTWRVQASGAAVVFEEEADQGTRDQKQHSTGTQEQYAAAEQRRQKQALSLSTRNRLQVHVSTHVCDRETWMVTTAAAETSDKSVCHS